VSLLLQNVWRYLHYEYVATPRRGGRRLWWWPYKEFVNMIRRAAWTASRCVGPSPRIGHLTTDSTANHRQDIAQSSLAFRIQTLEGVLLVTEESV